MTANFFLHVQFISYFAPIHNFHLKISMFFFKKYNLMNFFSPKTVTLCYLIFRRHFPILRRFNRIKKLWCDILISFPFACGSVCVSLPHHNPLCKHFFFNLIVNTSEPTLYLNTEVKEEKLYAFFHIRGTICTSWNLKTSPGPVL